MQHKYEVDKTDHRGTYIDRHDPPFLDCFGSRRLYRTRCWKLKSRVRGWTWRPESPLTFSWARALPPNLPLHVTAQKFENPSRHKFTGASFPRSRTSKFSNECRTKLPIMSLVSGEKVRGLLECMLASAFRCLRIPAAAESSSWAATATAAKTRSDRQTPTPNTCDTYQGRTRTIWTARR
jgi:hypothetical protein